MHLKSTILRSCSLEVFTAGNGKGYGLRTNFPISKGSFVIEYVGEVLTMSEVELRRKKHGEEGNYVLTLNEFLVRRNEQNQEKTGIVESIHIDAREIGNSSRFINHSCDPNLELCAVRRGDSVPHLCLFAKRNIHQFEELSFSYGDAPEQSSNTHGKGEYQTCLCGVAECTGVLPYDPKAP